MGKVYTTSEDLTSIANAIRAKAGTDSSLVYPTGFVSGILGILGDVWDGYGANPELLCSSTLSIAIKDTNWSTTTMSSTIEEIYISNNITTDILYDNAYDYRVDIKGYLKYKYTDNNELGKMSDMTIYIIAGGNKGFRRYYEGTAYIALNSSGQEVATYNNPGLTILAPGLPSKSNSYFVFPSIKIRLKSESTYFTDAIAETLDVSNTKANIDFKLYRYTKDSTMYTYDLITKFRNEWISNI